MDSKKYKIISSRLILNFDDKNCYSNGNALIKKDEADNDVTTEEISSAIQTEEQKFYIEYFQQPFENIIILAAAGTSMDNGSNSGKTRQGLWECCKTEIETLKAGLDANIATALPTEEDIEQLLSRINLLANAKLLKDGDIDNKNAVEKKIAEACKLVLDTEKSPHENFLNKITARKANAPRVQLFTTNYDTLFEQAASRAGFIVIDGFDFASPRTFSGRNFDYDIVNREQSRLKSEDSYISKVFHLYKLHGSLNWEKQASGKIVIKDNPENPHIIYPTSDKYESSYEQPYFEMMSRFQQAVRKDKSLLIAIGFGFQDKHIQNVIKEAVAQNPNFQLVIVNFNEKNHIDTELLKDFIVISDKDFIVISDKDGSVKPKMNVTILFDTFSSFVEHYPENKTYRQEQKNEQEQ